MKAISLLLGLLPLSASFTPAPSFVGISQWKQSPLCSTPEPSSVEEGFPVTKETSVPVEPTVAATSLGGSKQAEYGVSLEFPDSYVKCGRCQSTYSITLDDLGDARSKGRRLECVVCSHTWFQSKDRIMYKKDGFQMVPLPDHDVVRIKLNLEEGKAANFQGDCKLYVGNVSFECSEEDLMEIFGQVGPVGDVSMVLDETGRSRGFAFVTMRNKDDGQKAIDALDGSDVKGRGIAVRESNN